MCDCGQHQYDLQCQATIKARMARSGNSFAVTIYIEAARREGESIAAMLRVLASALEKEDHFKPENLINGVWGAAKLDLNNKQIGVLELI